MLTRYKLSSLLATPWQAQVTHIICIKKVALKVKHRTNDIDPQSKVMTAVFLTNVLFAKAAS
jgi:hypothetical protein